MSRQDTALPRGRNEDPEDETEVADQTTAPAHHSYNLRNKPRKNLAATEPKVTVPRTVVSGVNEEADHCHVGGHDGDASVPSSGAGEESEVSGVEHSVDLF